MDHYKDEEVLYWKLSRIEVLYFYIFYFYFVNKRYEIIYELL